MGTDFGAGDDGTPGTMGLASTRVSLSLSITHTHTHTHTLTHTEPAGGRPTQAHLGLHRPLVAKRSLCPS